MLRNTPSLSAVLDGAGLVVTANNVTIQGLEIRNVYNASNDYTGAAIEASGTTGLVVDGVTTRNVNNAVRDNFGGSNVTVRNSDLQARGDAVINLTNTTHSANEAFGALGRVYGNRIEMQGDFTSANVRGPDGIQAVNGLDVYGNSFVLSQLSSSTSTQHPDSIQWQGDYARIYGNTFTDVGDSNFDFDGFSDTTPTNIWIYNNVFRIVTARDPYPDFLRFYSSGSKPSSITGFKVMNNVFADANAGQGIPPVNVCYYQGGCNNPSTSGNEFTNNLFIQDGDGASSSDMLYLSGNAGANWTATRNVYYRSGGGYVYWKGTNRTAAAHVAEIDPNGSTSLPAFVSYALHAAGNDFHLSPSDSIARDTGISEAGYFTSDYDGLNRPRGLAWDRGPFER